MDEKSKKDDGVDATASRRKILGAAALGAAALVAAPAVSGTADAGTNRLAEFLTDLLNDPAKWDQFRRTPSEVVEKAGLNDGEKYLLMNGPAEALRRYIGKPEGSFTSYLIW